MNFLSPRALRFETPRGSPCVIDINAVINAGSLRRPRKLKNRCWFFVIASKLMANN
jgi:hypothetical protein